jgi:hypothetical protein
MFNKQLKIGTKGATLNPYNKKIECLQINSLLANYRSRGARNKRPSATLHTLLVHMSVLGGKTLPEQSHISQSPGRNLLQDGQETLA